MGKGLVLAAGLAVGGGAGYLVYTWIGCPGGG